jgi:hypothetical protein
MVEKRRASKEQEMVTITVQIAGRPGIGYWFCYEAAECGMVMTITGRPHKTKREAQDDLRLARAAARCAAACIKGGSGKGRRFGGRWWWFISQGSNRPKGQKGGRRWSLQCGPFLSQGYSRGS